MPFMHLEDAEKSAEMALNQISLHPPMLAIAAQLMVKKLAHATHAPAPTSTAKNSGYGGGLKTSSWTAFHPDSCWVSSATGPSL